MWKNLHRKIRSVQRRFLALRGIDMPLDERDMDPAQPSQTPVPPPPAAPNPKKQTVRISLPPKPSGSAAPGGHIPIRIQPSAGDPTIIIPAARQPSSASDPDPAPGVSASAPPPPARAPQRTPPTTSWLQDEEDDVPVEESEGISVWWFVVLGICVLLAGIWIGTLFTKKSVETAPVETVPTLVPSAAPIIVQSPPTVIPALPDVTKVPSLMMLVPNGTSRQTITHIVYPGVGTIFVPPSKWSVICSVPETDPNRPIVEGTDFDRKVNVGSSEYPVWKYWGNNTRNLDTLPPVRSYWIINKGTNEYGIRVQFELIPPTE